MSETRHVVLVKPGDVLLLGNVGEVSPEQAQALSQVLAKEMGIRVVVFTEDIDLAAVPHGHGD
ncbi:hypothetical protein ACFQ7O_24075 [Streptomyces sp. NPDC056485]|uniref:hypothetical protein n=1 Tax=Streptomyces sp. NPDC056485 TaxID=3345834 RepID=UPI0036C3E2B5